MQPTMANRSDFARFEGRLPCDSERDDGEAIKVDARHENRGLGDGVAQNRDGKDERDVFDGQHTTSEHRRTLAATLVELVRALYYDRDLSNKTRKNTNSKNNIRSLPSDNMAVRALIRPSRQFCYSASPKFANPGLISVLFGLIKTRKLGERSRASTSRS